MTLDKPTQDGSTDSAIQPADSKQELIELTSILDQQAETLPESADGSQALVAELLKHMAVADNVAKGVEERLDGIIENLDSLLSTLEEDSGSQQLPKASSESNGKEEEQLPS